MSSPLPGPLPNPFQWRGGKLRFLAVALAVACVRMTYAQEGAAEANETTSSPTTLEEVLVTGEQPGPGLWKVSKGDHVLWIFGTHSPLPKKMTWRSREVETILANSQELLTPVDVDPEIGFFGGLSLLPSLIGIRNNPEKEKLETLVPADLYARWLVQKEKYIGRDGGIEKWRPFFAANELYEEAIDQWGFKPAGFPPSDELREQIEKLAKRHKVKITHLTLPVAIAKPRAWVKDFKTMRLNEVDCFAQTVRSVETDRESLSMRANAWAIGNIAGLRSQTNIEQQNACIDVFFSILNSAEAQKHGIDNIPQKAVSVWVAAAEEALAKNKSTIAVLAIDQIFWHEGQLAKLRAKGYTVEEP